LRRIFVHRADAVEIFHLARGLTANHRLLLLDVIVDAAIGFHLLDLLHARDGTFDGLEIRQRAAEPAFRDPKLSAFLRGFFDGLLGLLLGAHEEHALAFADGRSEKIARGFELAEGLLRSMMWMPLRASKINGFILGFHRLVWCPK